MDKAIQKNITTYFHCFDNHVRKWNEVVEKIKRPLVGLKNQSEQLTHVERVNYDAELVQFPDLKDKLVFKILFGIDCELLLVKNAIAELNVLNQELRNKLAAFDKSTADFDWYNDNEKSGNAFQPRVSDLLQMGLESWKYYSEMYQSISSTLKTLDVRNSMSIQKLQDSFYISNEVQDRINYILAVTQYCNKNT